MHRRERVAPSMARALILSLVAFACRSGGGDRIEAPGHGSAPAAGAPTAPAAPADRADAGAPPGLASPPPRGVRQGEPCAGWTEQAASACARRGGSGCSLGAPIWCSGVAPSPEAEERLRTAPCQCVCPDDIARCSTRP